MAELRKLTILNSNDIMAILRQARKTTLRRAACRYFRATFRVIEEENVACSIAGEMFFAGWMTFAVAERDHTML